MSFVKYLRQREQKSSNLRVGIQSPSSIAFKLPTWERLYNEMNDGTEADLNAFRAGVFLHHLMGRLRDELLRFEQHVPVQAPDERAVAIVRMANRHTARLMSATARLLADTTRASLENLLHDRRVPDGSGQAHYTEGEALESLHDAIRLPLRRAAVQGASYGASNPTAPLYPQQHVDHVTSVSAQLYSAYEHVWEAVRWRGAKVDVGDVSFTVSDVSLQAADGVINRTRRLSRYGRETLRVLDASVLDEYLPEKLLVLSEDGGVRTQSSRAIDRRLNQIVQAVASQRYTTTDMFSKSLSEAKHEGAGVPLQKIVDAWVQLVVLCRQCQEQSNRWSQDSALDAQAAPVLSWSIDARELEVLLAECIGVPPNEAEDILRRLTFNGDVKHAEVWDRPLLRADGRFHLIWLPLIAPLFDRVIASVVDDRNEACLASAHAGRGALFEDTVVQALRMVCQASVEHRLRDAIVLSARLSPDDPLIGDVDCVLVLGDTAFCIECRIGKHAASPYEDWDQADDLLNKKGVQALRKRDYLLANPGFLADEAQRNGTPLHQPIRHAVAVVLSNSYLLEGTRQEEPFFVHADTLTDLLHTGPRFEDISDSGRKTEYWIDFFSDSDDVASSLTRAIKRPVKAEFYWACLTDEEFPLPGVAPDGPSGYVRQPVVRFPAQGELWRVLEQCSFKEYLKVAVDE